MDATISLGPGGSSSPLSRRAAKRKLQLCPALRITTGPVIPANLFAWCTGCRTRGRVGRRQHVMSLDILLSCAITVPGCETHNRPSILPSPSSLPVSSPALDWCFVESHSEMGKMCVLAPWHALNLPAELILNCRIARLVLPALHDSFMQGPDATEDATEATKSSWWHASLRSLPSR